MLEIETNNAEDYLRTTGRVQPDESIEIRALPGGVSNVVLYVHRFDSQHPDFVLKQARPRLRVPQPWFCGVERIWREIDVLRICQKVLASGHADGPPDNRGFELPAARTPAILFEDRENFLFAMSAAPVDHRVWKQMLLNCEFNDAIATACGDLLGKLHAGTWRDPVAARQLGDRKFFDQLRIDPYYRTVAGVHPDLASSLDRLIQSVWDHPLCLVHADFSPKNLLVYRGGLMMVDFETGHFGDPAFDLGFFLSHLVLKAFYHEPRHEACFALTESFYEAYQLRMAEKLTPVEYSELVARANQNFAGCTLARLDGKSQVEYLDDSRRRDQVRNVCRELFRVRPTAWSDVLGICRETLCDSDIRDDGWQKLG
jgi:hypothetical protein